MRDLSFDPLSLIGGAVNRPMPEFLRYTFDKYEKFNLELSKSKDKENMR